MFDDDIVHRHLDHLVEAQKDDGGWMFNWQTWNEATTQQWRAILTIEALLTLRAYGRLDQAHLTRDSRQLGGLPPAALLDWEAQRVGHPDEPRVPRRGDVENQQLGQAH
ncbi:MAG: hypothetical protein ACR2H7_03890 [Actinomycetota bacterium]